MGPLCFSCKSLGLLVVLLVSSYLVICQAANRKYSAIISNSGPLDSHAAFMGSISRPRSKRYVNRYNGRSMSSRGVSNKGARYLRKQHNMYRRQIEATNMEYMHYDHRLAASAQRHADRCDFAHSTDRARQVGENIWAASAGSYRDAVWLWYREGPDFGCQNWYRHICGHYTQVMWHNSNRFGCGFATCRGVVNVPYGYWTRVLVCQYHYGQKAVVPAFNYGRSCSECPSHAKRCRDGLCI